MQKRVPFLLLLAAFISACNLAGDITPPPGVATAQAVRPTVRATAVPEPTTAPVMLTPPKRPANLQNGEVLYVEKCSPCHGVDGGGDGPQAVNLPEGITPSLLSEQETAFVSTPAEWFSIVTVGNIERFMPGFSSLNDAERWDVVAYAFSLFFDAQDLAVGEEVYLEHCADCHGDGGVGTEIGSTLADPSFISNRTVEGLINVIGDGTDREMPGFGDELAAEELRSLSAYLMNIGFVGGASEAVDEIVTDPEEPVSEFVLGQVINGTNGVDIPKGISVTLHGFEGQQEVMLESVSVDDTGAFTFGELDLQIGWVFVATLEHQGVVYGSEIVEYTGEEQVFLPLTFFDSSNDLTAVSVDRLHTIFSVTSEGVLEVTELWIISNFSDHTVATSEGEGILEIPLPKGATNLQFDSGALGERYIATERGFVDTRPMRPGLGTHELVFSFEVPYGKRLDYRQAMDYPVDAIVILTPATGPELEGESIVDMGTSEMSGTLLRNYNAEPIQAGGVFELNIKGSGIGEGAAGTSTVVNLGIGIGSLILVAGAVGFWWFRRRESSIESVEEDEYQRARDERVGVEDQGALLRSIANLDNSFEAGEIEQLPYQEKRTELKIKLLKLMQEADHD